MGFDSLSFVNFRNLKDGEIALGAPQVLLIGENGQGKTNLIEAVHLLCVASSFRENKEPAFFRSPQSELAIAGVFSDNSQRRTLGFRIVPGQHKEIRLDGKLIADRKDLLGQVPCVCFVQQDIEFVAGSPEARRRFFDQTLLLCFPSLVDTHRDYRRVLRSRNFVLKQAQAELLDAYDPQLARHGLELSRARARLVDDFNRHFSPLFREITGWDGPVLIRHLPSWADLPDEASVLRRLESLRARDLAFGTTTSGPHRDLFSYIAGGQEFVSRASTGERRICSLILRVAQATLLAQNSGRRPVLLVDDVLLELDPGRKRAIIDRLPEYQQSIFTLLPDENFLPYKRPDALVLRVKDGGCTPW